MERELKESVDGTPIEQERRKLIKSVGSAIGGEEVTNILSLQKDSNVVHMGRVGMSVGSGSS